MSRNEAQTRFDLVDPALETRGWLRSDIRIEVTAAQIDIIDGKPRRRPAGRTDYLLRRPLAENAEPIPLAIIEAKREGLPPEHGLQQGKDYRVGELRDNGLGDFHATFGTNAAEVETNNPQKNARVLIATYQTLDHKFERGKSPKNVIETFFQRHYPPGFFDVIVIDECHRSAWGDWFDILRANAEGIHIGLTATPRQLKFPETHESEESEALGLRFKTTIPKPYRWRDWAAPESPLRQDKNASVWKFVHEDLLPKLKKLENQPGATARQRVISEIMSSVDRSRIDSEKNFLDVLDKVHEISSQTVDDTHVFTLSQVYEGLLLKMGEKGNDGGQFFTPREVIRAMVRVVDPKIGQTVYDPGCGTGGFLAQAYEYMKAKAGEAVTGPQLETLKRRTFFGREKDNAVYPIALANLVLHGIDEPHIWHGNSLSGVAAYDGLFQGAPQFYDVVLMNPPFGGKEGKEAQTPYEYKTGATQVLFLQNVLKSMRKNSHCGIVLDEGVLFRVDAEAFVKTKRKLLEECNVYCIVSLPGGVFTSAGAGVKTNLVFFIKGQPTEKIWYYDLSDVKVGKKTPITLRNFDDFFPLLPKRADSPRSWTVHFTTRLQTALDEARPHRERAAQLAAQAKDLEDEFRDKRKARSLSESKLAELEEKWKAAEREARESQAKGDAIENAAYDLKAVNPNRVSHEDTRKPQELLDFIARKGTEADSALAKLRALIAESK